MDLAAHLTPAELRKKLQKPAKGSAKLDRIHRQQKADARESANKTKVRKRDGHCRWPHQTEDAKALCLRSHSEVSHCQHKGAGGDKRTIRSKANRMINVCAPTHLGPGSIDAGDKKVVFLTPEKADGPIAFLERRGARWVEIARELWPGVLAPRKG